MEKENNANIVISVVIATYNRPDKLKQCLEALCKQNFDQDKFEVIVVNNGSDVSYETSYQLVKSLNLKTISLKTNVGPGQGRNYGIQTAKGSIVAFTDDDCLPPPDWLSSLYRGFKDTDIAGVGGFLQARADILRKNILAKWERVNERRYIQKMDKYLSTKRDESPFQTNNIAYLKSVLISVNGFDKVPPNASGEDGDLKEKIVKEGYKVIFLPIMMIHNQHYSWQRFFNQQMVRGAGNLYYLKKRGKNLPSKFELVLKLLLLPLYYLWVLRRLNYQLAFVDSFAFVARSWGKLKYYQSILNDG